MFDDFDVAEEFAQVACEADLAALGFRFDSFDRSEQKAEWYRANASKQRAAERRWYASLLPEQKAERQAKHRAKYGAEYYRAYYAKNAARIKQQSAARHARLKGATR